MSELDEMFSRHRAARAAILAIAIPAVDEFGEQVIGDAQELCPIDTGTLAGSGTPGRTAKEVAADSMADDKGGTISKLVGFNTDYAAAVHENLEAHHNQGEAKFLTNAVAGDAPKMAPYVASKLKAAGF